jgi:HD-GYP domain-containing protein (c-di-GMP phosphodiesterase class II)
MPEQDFQEALGRVIAQLTAAVTNTGLYSPAHPMVAQYTEKAYVVLTDLLNIRPEITLLLIGEDLVADNRPLPSGGAYVTNFVRTMKRKGIERMSFIPGLSRDELGRLIQDLAAGDGTPVRSSACVKLGKVELRVRQDGAVQQAADLSDAELQTMLKVTATELDEIKNLYFSIKKHKKIDVRGVDDVVKGFVTGFRREMNPLALLATLKSSHEYTFTHVTNVGILTMSQAQSLGFTGEHLHQIGVASLLHDVGKLFIPEEILNKPSQLNADERKIIETHTTKGARYLMGLEGIPKVAVLAALEHHLKYDGTGYPSIKGGWMPNIVSQIISIADVFDAMRSRRSYSEPMPMDKIEQVLLKGSGVSFNPKLVEHFLKLIKR